MRYITTLLLACIVTLSVFSSRIGPWNMDRLFEQPDWKETETAAQPGLTGILYSSIPYKGNPVEVFAYYGAPEGTPPEGGWPAMVCVHGGGGTAFSEWVQLWNDHGYAAISMDLEGHFPLRENPDDRRSPRISIPNPGPSRAGIFHDFEEPIEEQWYYHAVSQAILAHSLIRSFPEVNPEKIGVTGISWGGTLTSTIMGVDNRYKFAIPVYGCGFLPESDGNQGVAIKPGPHTEVVNKYYDGSAYFENVKIPTLWVNGTNDKHFPMPSVQKSSQAVQGEATLRIELEMRHGSGPGWAPQEIYAFAGSVVKGGVPLVQLDTPHLNGSIAQVNYASSTKLRKAEFLYTKDKTAWPTRKWQAMPAMIDSAILSAPVPNGAQAVFFNATDECGMMTSSEFIEFGPIKESTFSKSLVPQKFILPAEEGWWTWCMAPMYDEAGKLHMFNSAIPTAGRWHQESEVRHYVADSVEGPYKYVDTPFKSDTHTYHNPQISKAGDTYVMVYLWKDRTTDNRAQEIGIATAKSLYGPWTESPHNPILRASGEMDGANILHASNPTFLVDEDGKYRIYYKSMTDKYLPATHREISLAISDNIEGPYKNYSGNPLISYADQELDIEDPYAFFYKGTYYMIVEDRRAVKNMLEGNPLPDSEIKNGGNRPGLIYTSEDGINWSRPEIGYQTNTFYFGHELARTERPHILWKDGKPEYLFLACHDDDPTAGFYLKIDGWDGSMQEEE